MCYKVPEIEIYDDFITTLRCTVKDASGSDCSQMCRFVWTGGVAANKLTTHYYLLLTGLESLGPTRGQQTVNIIQ